MKPKHTPGPWSVDIHSEMATTIAETGRHSITGIYLSNLSEKDNETAYQLDEANARLIAAAPEMLEALEQITAFISDHVEEHFGCYDGFGKRDQANTRDFYNRPELKALFKAIAKAQGGAE